MGDFWFGIKEKVKLQPFRFLSEAISLAETTEEMVAVRTKNLNTKSTRRQPQQEGTTIWIRQMTNPQPQKEKKGRRSTNREIVNEKKKKESMYKNNSHNNYTRSS